MHPGGDLSDKTEMNKRKTLARGRRTEAALSLVIRDCGVDLRKRPEKIEYRYFRLTSISGLTDDDRQPDCTKCNPIEML